MSGTSESATPTDDIARRCGRCNHLGRAGTCLEPVAAGLLPQFELFWPEPGYAATCPAWDKAPLREYSFTFQPRR